MVQHHIKAERNIVKALMRLPEDDDLTAYWSALYCSKHVSLTSDGISFANI